MTDDAEWLEWRKAGLGASDIANAVSGRYGGPYAVVADKLGVFRDESNAKRKQLGLDWEDRIADAVHSLTGYWVVGEQTWCEHPDHPHYRCTVDGFAAMTAEATPDDLVGVVEIKTQAPNVPSAWASYADQTQWQMMVNDLPLAIVAEATIPHEHTDRIDLRVEVIHADPDRQAFLVDVAEWLWQHIQAGTYPDPDSPAALDAVKARHATAIGEDEEKALEPVDLEPLAEVVARHKDIKEAIKAADDELRTCEAQIREALGSRRRGVAPGWSVSLSAPTRVLTEPAEAAFLAVHPECAKTVIDRTRAEQVDKALLDQLREPVGHRTLRISRKKTT